MKYYILNISHARKKDHALLFWGKNDSGYYYNLNDAGKYDERNVDTSRDVLVPCDLVDSLSDTYVIDNNAIGKICLNNIKNRKRLKVNYSSMLSGDSAWDSRAFRKPEIKSIIKKFGYSIIKDNNIKNNCSIAGKNIFIGEYNDEELLLISIFHEHGHNLIPRSFIELVNFNTLLIELEAWNLGLKCAAEMGYFFSDEAIKWAYNKKALSYVGYDKREVMNWHKTTKQKLWKYKNTNDKLHQIS